MVAIVLDVWFFGVVLVFVLVVLLFVQAQYGYDRLPSALLWIHVHLVLALLPWYGCDWIPGLLVVRLQDLQLDQGGLNV